MTRGDGMAIPEKARPQVRHELKYYIPYGCYVHLSRTLSRVLWPDEHGDENNEYHIRSLYFDDAFDTAYNEKIMGIEHRDKYRIRIYNFSDKIIQLERKSKICDLISKTSVSITRRACDKLCAGDPTGLEKAKHPLLRDMYIKVRTHLLRPAVLVDYVREAYIHPAEHVRITFDKQVHSGLLSHDLFEPYVPMVSPLDSDFVILEVKFDDYLPGYIGALIADLNAERNAISKYTLSRRFEPLAR